MSQDNSKHAHDALSIKVRNEEKDRGGSWYFKAKLPILEVVGYSFYLSWMFLLYWGQPLTPTTLFDDQQSHVLRITMIAVVAVMYLLAGIFAKPLASKSGFAFLVISTLIFGLANCLPALGIFDISFQVTTILWAICGIGHATLLLLWSKHLVLFTRKQLILITAIAFVAAGSFYVTINYLQPVPSVIATAMLPLASLAFYILGNKGADRRVEAKREESLNSEALSTQKKPLKQLYVFATAYCIALGFMGACITMVDLQQSSILFIGLANILAGTAIIVLLMKFRRDVARVVASFFLPCMALGIFLFAFSGLNGRLICIVILFFLFACNDIVNTTTISKTSPLYGVNYIRTFGFGRFPNGLGVLVGWLLGYVIFFVYGGAELGIIFISFLLVVVFVFVKVFVLDNDSSKTIIVEHAAFAPPKDFTSAKADFSQDIQGTQGNPPYSGVMQQADTRGPDITIISVQKLSEDFNLSTRQIEVFHLLAKGRNAEYIQEKLFISNHTAKSHIYTIYRKLGVHSQQELLNKVESLYDSLS